MKTIDKIVRLILGFVGTTFEIPRLIIKYVLGLIWTAYMLVRGKDFKLVFSKLNSGMIGEIKWVLDEFKFYT
jgi:hypothetical protein